ncbi:MAG: 3-hydroxybutyryl-CoA dehydrogenase [Ruminococcaceae bacterium]|nr:3-hydroxybutyryl-CoA dehydrogenase [Oscillospiraceae bacterium]
MSKRIVGLIGTGMMGGGIAQVCAQAGYETISYDINAAAFERTKGIVRDSLNKMVTRGKFTEEFANEVEGRMSYTTNLQDLKDCCIVVEAVFENVDVKKNVLKQVEEVVSRDCLIFTNTSALSITTLATALEHRDRFMGAHFFSPVPAMKLLELIPGMDTSTETYEKCVAWGKEIGKVLIDAPDTSGFISNRVLPLVINECNDLVVAGIDPADIDYCYKLLFTAPMGPLEMEDNGTDVFLGTCKSVFEGNEDERYRPHPYVKKLVAAGRLGRKTGQGVYKY